MNVWLYYRINGGENSGLNSLANQQKILMEYTKESGYNIVGESFDDNICGMHFNREGIKKIYDAVDKKIIDAVIVKDLSRLGRDKTQVVKFIDYLREHGVQTLSVTENIDTFDENDDLMACL